MIQKKAIDHLKKAHLHRVTYSTKQCFKYLLKSSSSSNPRYVLRLSIRPSSISLLFCSSLSAIYSLSKFLLLCHCMEYDLNIMNIFSKEKAFQLNILYLLHKRSCQPKYFFI